MDVGDSTQRIAVLQSDIEECSLDKDSAFDIFKEFGEKEELDRAKQYFTEQCLCLRMKVGFQYFFFRILLSVMKIFTII